MRVIDGKAGVDRIRGRHLDECGCALPVPRRDRAVQIGKNEAGSDPVHQKRIERGVERGTQTQICNLAGWSLRTGCRRRNGDDSGALGDGAGRRDIVERREIGNLIGDPDRRGRTKRDAPGVLQNGVGERCQPRDVRNEIGLNVSASLRTRYRRAKHRDTERCDHQRFPRTRCQSHRPYPHRNRQPFATRPAPATPTR